MYSFLATEHSTVAVRPIEDNCLLRSGIDCRRNDATFSFSVLILQYTFLSFMLTFILNMPVLIISRIKTRLYSSFNFSSPFPPFLFFKKNFIVLNSFWIKYGI